MERGSMTRYGLKAGVLEVWSPPLLLYFMVLEISWVAANSQGETQFSGSRLG